MILKPELSHEQVNACLQLMRQGLKIAIDSQNADGAIDAYVAIRGHFVAAASAPKASPEIEEVQPQ